MTLNLYILSLLFVFTLFHPGNVKRDNEQKENVMHPFYVSVVEVEQNSAENTLEISYKFFPDDFEKTLEKKFKTSLNIYAEKDKISFDKFIPAYINNSFALTINGSPVTLSYIGYEIEKESVYCYFEVKNITSVKKININNRLLYDFIKNQINIMHISINGKRQSMRLSYPATKAAFVF